MNGASSNEDVAGSQDIGGNQYITELLGILKDSGRDSSGLSALINHIKGMEDFVKAAESQIAGMKSQLNAIKEIQDHPIRTTMQNSAKALETALEKIKAQIAALKADVINGCKNAIAAFKEKGITALDKLASFFRVKGGLQAINRGFDNSIKQCRENNIRIGKFSNEYHATGLHLKNMARLLVGSKPIDTPKETGIIAKAMMKFNRAQISYMRGMQKSIRNAIGRIERHERLEQPEQPETNPKAALLPKMPERKPTLMEKLEANKEKIKKADLEANLPERLPKTIGAER
jgi:hypothetical protein